jgi:hypothetical protein
MAGSDQPAPGPPDPTGRGWRRDGSGIHAICTAGWAVGMSVSPPRRARDRAGRRGSGSMRWGGRTVPGDPDAAPQGEATQRSGESGQRHPVQKRAGDQHPSKMSKVRGRLSGQAARRRPAPAADQRERGRRRGHSEGTPEPGDEPGARRPAEVDHSETDPSSTAAERVGLRSARHGRATPPRKRQ